ncbi:arginine biosynthesis bifunctional protein ArgJ [Ruminiclostridium papyrosolvens DSM 2782]|uniref:Arginine biosynthesis bifunctional protein ArgJ n=1 Tax=Ruminiclostridium papyrosolvens DSM 2782 TaxID=588581 RepID=F1THU8_9FIRM|nr:bifunctional glutamate N-acetyltransferase/amino-acid acetyltransferase ArgJ [Ruminiclostridium papyrosolvens]EGD46080.1 arginine biosynthesis bifunctional protein ArgJ [Ruminiclostridium papyrosolvens DSM 2782]WES32879.1 bifunctional glutamate N-acetyltransferase/amino-acid acetyltransferase ArgJ [Ruminiclostridium papyrosolvens DSM 2782]
MNIIDGGVTAPKGFKAAGVACGIKKNNRKDLAIVCSEDTAVASGVFTTNVVKGHSLQVSMEHIKNGFARAIVINSGNANACVGETGYKDAKEMTELTAELLQCDAQDVLVNATGVIGTKLNMPSIRSGIRSAVNALSSQGGSDAEEAIMTTDLMPKEIAVDIELQGETVRIGGIAKGSGMIHPNMATMIGILTTDANISRSLLDKALKQCVKKTFNRVSVDGDTSVCDSVFVLANGFADNDAIVKEDYEYSKFVDAMMFVCTYLAKLMAKDGEGATKLIEIQVDGAGDESDAYKVVSTVAKSPLVKTAIFGEDANWGRIFTAVGYSGASFDPNLTDIYIGDILVCRNGAAANFDEAAAKELLKKKEIIIKINLKKGNVSDRIWTCDFSYDYVKINGSYRS